MATCRLWMLCLAALLVLEGHCGLKISNCVNGSVDVAEDKSASFTCGTFSSGWLNWYAYNDLIGYCDEKTCYPDNTIYKLRLESSSSAAYSSVLTITKVYRNRARRLYCVNYAAEHECSLRIFAPARIVPGDCSVTISNYRVQGSCQVKNMYMLNDSYTCTWRENGVKITGDFHGKQKYYNRFKREYWKAVCSFSKVMPVDQKEFTYRIEISPGSQDFFVKTVNILPPNKPEYNCTDTVIVGSNVTCTCTSLNMGNPPANLAWDGKTDGVLLLQDVQRENDNSKYTCRLTWGPNGFINHTIVYTLRVVEKEQASAANVKAWMIGGFIVAAMLIAIIGTLITIFIVKWRKGTICKGKINLRLWPCSSHFCHRRNPLSQTCAVVNMSHTPIIRHAAPSGDLYTVVMTTTSGQVEDEYVTLSQTTENTEIDKVCNPQESQDLAQTTESRTRPTLQSQRTTAGRRNFSDLTGTCYMNVTEVPTDSGLGVYHIVPWAVVPTQHQPDTGVNSEAVISEEEYNVLQFQEDRTRQEDHADIYHHIEHS